MDDRRETLFKNIQQRSLFLGKDHPVISPKPEGLAIDSDVRRSMSQPWRWPVTPNPYRVRSIQNQQDT